MNVFIIRKFRVNEISHTDWYFSTWPRESDVQAISLLLSLPSVSNTTVQVV